MIKVNLGCGWRNFGKDWIHIDGGDYEHLNSKDVINLPYDDNSIDLIYASHLIAYFNRDEIKEILKKWFKKLKPGGVFRVATPDFKSIVKLIENGSKRNTAKEQIKRLNDDQTDKMKRTIISNI